jgi:hypothetical protein
MDQSPPILARGTTAVLDPLRPHPQRWISVAFGLVCVAFAAWAFGQRTAAGALVGAAGLVAIAGMVFAIRRLRGYRAALAATIDAHLAERDARGLGDTEEDAARRAAVVAFRDRLTGPKRGDGTK